MDEEYITLLDKSHGTIVKHLLPNSILCNNLNILSIVRHST